MYYKQDLSAKHRIDLDVPTYTLVLEVNFGKKKVIIVHSYRKFGQSKDEYDDYITKFEELLDTISAENPYCCICVGDLNAHNKKWLSGGVTDVFGENFQEIFEKNYLTHIVNQPTYVRNNSKTLVDICATSQPNLVVANEVYTLLNT